MGHAANQLATIRFVAAVAVVCCAIAWAPATVTGGILRADDADAATSNATATTGRTETTPVTTTQPPQQQRQPALALRSDEENAVEKSDAVAFDGGPDERVRTATTTAATVTVTTAAAATVAAARPATPANPNNISIRQVLFSPPISGPYAVCAMPIHAHQSAQIDAICDVCENTCVALGKRPSIRASVSNK